MPADEGKVPAPPVLLAALQLGCSAFGGPVAHLGIIRRSFVERRRWIDPDTFASIVALCQVLPGPTGRQTGFLIGWYRAGWRGAFAGDGKFPGEFSGLRRVFSLKITGDARWVSALPLDQPPGSPGWVIELDRNSGTIRGHIDVPETLALHSIEFTPAGEPVITLGNQLLWFRHN